MDLPGSCTNPVITLSLWFYYSFEVENHLNLKILVSIRSLFGKIEVVCNYKTEGVRVNVVHEERVYL